MLGLVRIFNRKVKYLMSDCTEAMWKIKLAFKAPTGEAVHYGTNVTSLDLISCAHNVCVLSEHPITHTIDDSRYFGHIVHDSDYPELADAAFIESQVQAARRSSSKTIASERDTTTELQLGILY